MRVADMLAACRRYLTGVTVVTTLREDGHPVGLTVNSFTPVSLAPPLVLVCVHRGCRVYRDLVQCGRFAVNVLSARQQDLAVRFASDIGDRFTAVTWDAGSGGLPLIRDALATFECRLADTVAGGDHKILIGRVEIVADRHGPPLIRYDRSYCGGLDDTVTGGP